MIGRAGSAPSAPASTGAYDPGEHTVAEVQSYVDAHPESVDAVYASEQAGKGRVTLLDWLAAKEG